MSDPLVPDWTTYLGRCEQRLKAATEAFSKRDWQRGVDEMAAAKHQFSQIEAWLIKREILERGSR
jgi:hypothetical protein